MAMRNPSGRVNYEPNSWGVGPRECHKTGFVSYGQTVQGIKERLRSDTFSDHYSQARQFYISQTEVEQTHIADALGFELSKVDRVAIRERMVAHLRNIDEKLAATVAKTLGIDPLPDPIPAAKPTRDLPPSDALSILKNGPGSFRGRKLGILTTDGAAADIIAAIEQKAAQEGVACEFIAPRTGFITLSDGSSRKVNDKVDGGPSVLYDAVVIAPAQECIAELEAMPPAVEFVMNAFNHKKFVGFTADAKPLFDAAGLAKKFDKGCMALSDDSSVADFVRECGALRFWARP